MDLRIGGRLDDGRRSESYVCLFVCLFDATFNNISVISWRSVLLVEETGGPGENQTES
jgi:hypothetical protein